MTYNQKKVLVWMGKHINRLPLPEHEVALEAGLNINAERSPFVFKELIKKGYVYSLPDYEVNITASGLQRIKDCEVLIDNHKEWLQALLDHVTAQAAEIAELKKPLEKPFIAEELLKITRDDGDVDPEAYDSELREGVRELLTEAKRLRSELAKREAQLFAERKRDEKLLTEALNELLAICKEYQLLPLPEGITMKLIQRLKGEGKS